MPAAFAASRLSSIALTTLAGGITGRNMAAETGNVNISGIVTDRIQNSNGKSVFLITGSSIKVTKQLLQH